MKRSLVFGALAAAAALLPSAVFAADIDAQIAAAGTHAGLAAGSDNIDDVQTHLQHVLNCLVGPKGEGFAAAEMNPCTNLGNGAIPDAIDQERKIQLKQAAESAKAGIAADNMDTAAKQAGETAALINGAN
ncbi:hypothetical protein V6C03_14350 [Methyloligella sp. 2.7D]|uniref:hypothetical protein n=1 Tax=unclassified Methyloligella TaxID=2625955 RepID=UPI00157BBDD9|nr:hypothetical protein [Methyloligella sp. GL2]QKP77064.1 hypothetical protein HT051_06115 [Methyloligella sp. GL2]